MVIPVLLILAVAYWLAAPDPVTAGARTAAGTGIKAAGAGIRDHWSSGRDSRALTRTNRRDRWSKGGGFWRNLLRLEHGAVITVKGVKGAAGITRAAVKPVPAAAKAGWVSGRDRHRAKAGNRPVPVALDPPWWRREQPQVQPGEQAPEQVEDDLAEQVQASGGQVTATTVIDENRAHCSRCLSPVGRYWAECRTCQATLTGLMTASGEYLPPADDADERIPAVGHIPTDPEGLGEMIRRLPTGRDEYGQPYIDDVILLTRLRKQEGEAATDLWNRAIPPIYSPAGDSPAEQVQASGGGQGDGTGDLDTEEQIRDRRTPTWNRLHPGPLTESDRQFWTARDAGDAGPLDRDGRPGDPDQWPFKSVTVPTDTTTEQRAGASPAGSVIEVGKSTSRCGTCGLHVDPESKACPHCSARFTGISSDYPEFEAQVAAIRPDLPLIRHNAHPVGAEATGGSVNNIPTELRDHVRVQDFAAQIDNLSESSDFVVVAEKARTVGENSRSGGFGREMDLAVDSLEETARRFAVSVDDFREKAHDLAKTSRSVQGS